MIVGYWLLLFVYLVLCDVECALRDFDAMNRSFVGVGGVNGSCFGLDCEWLFVLFGFVVLIEHMCDVMW